MFRLSTLRVYDPSEETECRPRDLRAKRSRRADREADSSCTQHISERRYSVVYSSYPTILTKDICPGQGGVGERESTAVAREKHENLRRASETETRCAFDIAERMKMRMGTVNL